MGVLTDCRIMWFKGGYSLSFTKCENGRSFDPKTLLRRISVVSHKSRLSLIIIKSWARPYLIKVRTISPQLISMDWAKGRNCRILIEKCNS